MELRVLPCFLQAFTLAEDPIWHNHHTECSCRSWLGTVQPVASVQTLYGLIVYHVVLVSIGCCCWGQKFAICCRKSLTTGWTLASYPGLGTRLAEPLWFVEPQAHDGTARPTSCSWHLLSWPGRSQHTGVCRPARAFVSCWCHLPRAHHACMTSLQRVTCCSCATSIASQTFGHQQRIRQIQERWQRMLTRAKSFHMQSTKDQRPAGIYDTCK